VHDKCRIREQTGQTYLLPSARGVGLAGSVDSVLELAEVDKVESKAGNVVGVVVVEAADVLHDRKVLEGLGLAQGSVAKHSLLQQLDELVGKVGRNVGTHSPHPRGPWTPAARAARPART
jgi:hypothetical protein